MLTTDVLRKKKEALDFLTKCAEHYRPSISVVTIAEIMAGLRPEFYDKTKEFHGLLHGLIK